MTDGLTSQLSLWAKSWLGRIKMRRTIVVFSAFIVAFFLFMTYSIFRIKGPDSYSVKAPPSGHLSMIHLLNAEGYYESSDVNVTERNPTLLNGTNHREIWSHPQLDILHTDKINFLSNFKNPCWYEELQEPNVYQFNKYIVISRNIRTTMTELMKHWAERISKEKPARRLRCLPYFLIVGQPKCGTTDVYRKIVKHPDVINPPIKELHWWSRNRQGRRLNYTDIIPLSDYIDMFDMAAYRIENRHAHGPEVTNPDASYHHKVTGEASASILWENDDWFHFKENTGFTEPKYTSADYIRHVIPKVKVIICVRNPTDRLYSDYLYFTKTNKSAEDFHNAVSYAVEVYKNCTERHSVRYCVYNRTIAYMSRVRLRLGMYSVYIKDWLRVFPKSQVLILSLEDYAKHTRKILNQVYKFLDISSLDSDQMRSIVKLKVANKRKKGDRSVGLMLNETRQLLNEFYEPYNQELADIMDDDQFLWEPEENDYESMEDK
uniref:Carbohydrate sulfotransferase 15-like isoform X1 n=1 Tax=Crassostrea virginica TaxID=6565 RepID=A0A8B8EYN0_CRAVI|nr:carbohydrate sulfotransferase 15-like isoform X1 [Crassostrea virginica]XP_022345101.1 carbohydrate sulfotransferase 15-like isoform X1 [Crassostrea virginica]